MGERTGTEWRAYVAFSGRIRACHRFSHRIRPARSSAGHENRRIFTRKKGVKMLRQISLSLLPLRVFQMFNNKIENTFVH
jgi:hypothetical protein